MTIAKKADVTSLKGTSIGVNDKDKAFQRSIIILLLLQELAQKSFKVRL
jgi:hypothetical protein